MPLPTITHRSAVSELLHAGARVLLAAAGLGLLAIIILLSPAALRLVDDGGSEWARLGDIGQAYGPVSALLSALALCVALLVQRRQIRQERVTMARELNANALRTAMEEAAYGQCWGPRVTPDHLDERLFYYVSSILNAWYYAYECGDLSEGAVRAYARSMADSEIPRAYWARHGEWRLHSVRGRRRRFLRLVDEEFRAAEAAGPPARAAERFPARGARPPRPQFGSGAERRLPSGTERRFRSGAERRLRMKASQSSREKPRTDPGR